MHAFNCLEPKVIYNPYIKDKVVVPCGKCAACLNAKSARMCERLKQEAQCHNFVWFSTLTYDNEHLPILKKCGDVLIDCSPSRVHPKLGVFKVDILEELHKLGTSAEENSRAFDFIRLSESHFGGLPYGSSVDVQRFMKRLRKHIDKQFKLQQNIHHEKSSPKIRYYIVCEIGPTTYRPHFHVLFFLDSQWLASHLASFISDTWKNGNTDTSVVTSSAVDYCAKYLNSVSHLPLVYQTASLRPFALFSKHPAIGSLIYRSEDLRQMFLAGTVEQVIYKKKQNLFDDVPLWRTLQDRLYPRLAYFDFLPDRVIKSLYLAFYYSSKRYGVEHFYTFKQFVLKHDSVEYKDYLNLLYASKGDFERKLQRWYYVTSRITAQAFAWDIDVTTYIKCIVKFYNNLKLSKLARWYQFAEDYSKLHGSSSDLLWFDPLFLRDTLDCNECDLTYTERMYLQSFGIDFSLWFSDDPQVRINYQSRFYPENTEDFKIFNFEQKTVFEQSLKTKQKNDYAYTQSDWYADLISHGFQNVEAYPDNKPTNFNF